MSSRPLGLASGALLLVLLAPAAPSHAQPDPEPSVGGEESTELEPIAFESFQAPALPAMALLNADVSNVERPGSVRDLGVVVSNLISPDGAVRAGVAIEVTPRLLGSTISKSAYQYRNDWWVRFVSRIGLSIATTAEAATMTNPSVTRLAGGLRFVFFDDADPLMDPASVNAQAYAEQACKDEPPLEQQQCQLEHGQQYLDDAEEPAWNLGGLALAGAVSAAFVDGETDEGSFDNVATWLNFAHPIGTVGQIMVSARYRHHDGDNWDAGGFGRLRLGSAATRGFVEGGLISETAAGAEEKRLRTLLGAEVRLAKSVWLVASIGGEFGNDPSEDNDVFDLFALSNLEWALDNEPSWPEVTTE